MVLPNPLYTYVNPKKGIRVRNYGATVIQHFVNVRSGEKIPKLEPRAGFRGKKELSICLNSWSEDNKDPLEDVISLGILTKMLECSGLSRM